MWDRHNIESPSPLRGTWPNGQDARPYLIVPRNEPDQESHTARLARDAPSERLKSWRHLYVDCECNGSDIWCVSDGEPMLPVLRGLRDVTNTVVIL